MITEKAMSIRDRVQAANLEELPAIAAELAEAQAALTLRLHAPRSMPAGSDEDELLEMPEVARTLGICLTLAREQGRRGEIPTVQVGGRGVRVRRGALRDYIRKHERGATMPARSR